jgi:hypothetical protein
VYYEHEGEASHRHGSRSHSKGEAAMEEGLAVKDEVSHLVGVCDCSTAHPQPGSDSNTSNCIISCIIMLFPRQFWSYVFPAQADSVTLGKLLRN